jgi:hypothetical protein
MCAMERMVASYCESLADYNAAWDMTKTELVIFGLTKRLQRMPDK